MSSAITNPSTTVAAAAATGSNPYAELNSSDFLQIMLSELANQDPFEPNDSAAILEQLSSLRSIESDLSLQDQLESLVLQSTIGQAGTMIGKVVEGLDTSNRTIRGTVQSVRIVDGKATLEFENGVTLGLDRVTAVTNPAPASPLTSIPTPPVATSQVGGDAAASNL